MTFKSAFGPFDIKWWWIEWFDFVIFWVPNSTNILSMFYFLTYIFIGIKCILFHALYYVCLRNYYSSKFRFQISSRDRALEPDRKAVVLLFWTTEIFNNTIYHLQKHLITFTNHFTWNSSANHVRRSNVPTNIFHRLGQESLRSYHITYGIRNVVTVTQFSKRSHYVKVASSPYY